MSFPPLSKIEKLHAYSLSELIEKQKIGMYLVTVVQMQDPVVIKWVDGHEQTTRIDSVTFNQDSTVTLQISGGKTTSISQIDAITPVV